MSLKLEELNKDVAELNQLSALATRSKVKDILLIETRKIETEIIRLRELEGSVKNDETTKTPSTTNNSTKCYDVTITNYAWDQSGKFVKIFVDLTGVQDLPNENVKCDFGSNEMKLTVSKLNNRNYTKTIKNLLFPIQPNNSYWKIKKDKVVVFMQKAKEDKKWSSLTASEKPTKKIEEMEPHTDPSEGMINIMKQLYDDGDDEMKRTIAKAWTEGQNKRM